MNLLRDGEGFVFTAVVVLNCEKELRGGGICVNGCFQAVIEWRVDKVLGFWKAEWINRKTRDLGATGFTRYLLRYRRWGVLTSKNSLEMAKRKALEQRPKCLVENEWSANQGVSIILL